MKKFFAWLSFVLDYVASVFIFMSLNKFFLVSEVLDRQYTGIGVLIVLFLVLMSLLIMFAFVFWHDNQRLDEKLRVKHPSWRDHLKQSSFFYFALIFFVGLLFYDWSWFSTVLIPVFVTLLAIALNAIYLYRKDENKKWGLF